MTAPNAVEARLSAALFECMDKLWIARCDSRDEKFRAAAERAIEMGSAAQDALRAKSGGAL